MSEKLIGIGSEVDQWSLSHRSQTPNNNNKSIVNVYIWVGDWSSGNVEIERREPTLFRMLMM